MGKIRIKTFGDEEQEQKDQKRKERQEARKDTQRSAEPRTEEKAPEVSSAATAEAAPEAKEKKSPQARQHKDSGRYTDNAALIDKKTVYSLNKALATLKKFKTSKFDETVELHLNVVEKGINGQVSLPHGTGKKLRIKIADDALIDSVAKGVIDFDILVAKPDMMPKLAKVARVLGPRGLMPNPKNGTVTPNPDEIIGKLSAGQVNYKTEAQNPIIHLTVGKVSFKEDQLEDNIKTVLSSIGVSKIKSATLKSTMSPGIKLQVK